MGALDKLNKRKEEDTKSKAPAKAKATTAPKKATPKAAATRPAKPIKTDKPVKKEVSAAPVTTKTVNIMPEPVITSSEKNNEQGTEAKKLGRPVVRGEKNKDYRMVNLAVPIDMYDELKSHAGGNVTFFINQLLREALDQRRY